MQFLELITLTALLQCVSALHCDKDALANYRLAEYFKEVTTQSFINDTPPSKTNTTWYFNLCGQQENVNENCPANSQICGIQEVSLPGEQPIKTQIISFGNGLSYNVNEDVENLLSIKLDESSWGSHTIFADINLACSKEDKDDIQVVWDTSILNITWSTPAACLKSDKDVPPPKDGKDTEPGKDKDADDSWGWFTWLFIILVLLFGGYIIIGAWITASRSPADIQDAFHDFVDTLANLGKALPGLIREVFSKVVGSGENRGGYSAV